MNILGNIYDLVAVWFGNTNNLWLTEHLDTITGVVSMSLVLLCIVGVIAFVIAVLGWLCKLFDVSRYI